METRDLIRILKRIRGKRLRLIELCPKLIGEDGTIDPQKVAFYYDELQEAAKEAEQYSKETQQAVRCLRELAHSNF